MVDVPDNIDILENSLQKISKEDTSPGEILPQNRDWKRVECILLQYLEADNVFAGLFRKFSYQGSTYENLKVGPRDEYDINVELKLSDFYELEIDVEDTNPGYAKVKIIDSTRKQPSEQVRRKVETWLHESTGYLSTHEILNWFKSVVDKAVVAIKKANEFAVEMFRSESGPAITLVIYYNQRKFSVDLVPALPFAPCKMPVRQNVILRRVIENMGQKCNVSVFQKQDWHLVPKKPSLMNLVEWRMSFYLYEMELMNDLNGMKFVIRILKVLRDRRQWNPLESYYIKTVFLWELENYDPGFWSRKSRSYLFYHMLKKLVSYLENNSIEFFWDENCNLVQDLDKDFLKNVEMFISSRIKKLNRALDGISRGQTQPHPDDILMEMFSHATKESARVETSGQSSGFGDLSGMATHFATKESARVETSGQSSGFGDLSGMATHFATKESARVETSGQSSGFGDFLLGMATHFSDYLTPLEKQGIEENEGLIEDLDNGYSRPVNDAVRERQQKAAEGRSNVNWFLLAGGLAAAGLGIAALALNTNTTTTAPTTTTTTNTTTTTTSGTRRRYQ